MKFKPFALAAITALWTLQVQAQQPRTIVVDPGKQTAKIQPEMWGVFFEDINMGADGGIYAELIKNRSFEFYKPLMGWKIEGKRVEGDLLVLNRQESKSSNPRYIRIKTGGKQTDLALYNEGFKGIGVKKGLEYDFSVMYRQQQKGLKLYVALVDSAGRTLGQGTMIPEKADGQWQSQHVSFKSDETVQKASFKIWFEGEGAIDLDMISLFPGDTWKNRKGGLRGDMVQLLADMKPGFVRFPGGCIVEGHDLSTRYQWKKTIGPVADREVIINRWNTEFAHRPSPDYYQTFGLGFYEYFQLAEDIGATALPILNCGMACQFNTAELVPLDELDPYIQDALDLVEFANGAVSTPWGKVRAEMGHPEPFNLKMLGVGNENWGPQYLERLELFTKALKSKYPEIRLVNSSGTDPDGERFDLLNTSLRKMKADIIDEHYYRSPDWFLKNANRYDGYDRKGSKVFAGEYAAQSKATASPDNQNNWECAIAEAAFLTGLERNAEVVHMASYAPLFAHAEGWQWTPDMIWVDNLNVYGTPNYYVQKLYSLYKGTDVVSILEDNKFVSGQHGIYASAVTDNQTGELIIKIINPGKEAVTRDIQIKGSKKAAATAQLILLQNNSPAAVNTFSNAVNVSPETAPLTVKNNKVSLELKPYSFNVIRIDLSGKGVL